uniref:Uncharacterized protein n=1 Tax=Oryza brachyantha TaxID=4533 RepID=J3LI41_ORYBR
MKSLRLNLICAKPQALWCIWELGLLLIIDLLLSLSSRAAYWLGTSIANGFGILLSEHSSADMNCTTHHWNIGSPDRPDYWCLSDDEPSQQAAQHIITVVPPDRPDYRCLSDDEPSQQAAQHIITVVRHRKQSQGIPGEQPVHSQQSVGIPGSLACVLSG